MLTALILVCSLASVPDLSACTRDNALALVQVPSTFTSPVTCLMYGQAYLAETSIGRELSENEAVKVVCVRTRPTEIGALPPQPAKAHPDESPGR